MNVIMSKINSSKPLQYVLLALIAVLAAFNYEIFIFPNSFAPAGINGVATMIQHALNFSFGYMSLIINIPMLIIAIFVLNRSYATRTLTHVLTFAVSLLILRNLDLSAIKFVAKDGGEAILAAIAGGFFSGIFYSLSIRLGGSTGGTDIVGSFIHKKSPEFDTVWIIFTINAIVAASSFFVYDFSYKPVILCIIYCFVNSRVSDAIFKGSRGGLRFEVITKDAEALANELMQNLRHGCTVINATGMYSHAEQKMLICVVNRRQIVDFETILSKYEHSFATVCSVKQIFGNFKKIK